ncbi:hypothetical protein [Streptomyces sp. NPDC014733]|uniref:hypothetical protein n=1 Tax=Streptomyces sp. NPDC014733 TaxID=3364885 RepID=UPI0036FBF2D4
MPDRRRRAAPLLPLAATSPGAARLPGEGVLSSAAVASSAPLPLRFPAASAPGLALRSGEPGGSGSGTGPGSGSGADDGSGAGAGSGTESDSGSGSGQEERNPFAPPPEGAPDQEWRPRRRAGQDGSQGSQPEGGQGEDTPPTWGSQWSSRQPGRQSGGFGNRPGRPTGQGGPEGRPGGLRWDPTDPAQRRARYALLAGMWAFFFALFSLPEVALLLGALALYWGISSLRAKPRAAKPSAAATTAAMEGRPAPSAAPAGTGPAAPVPGRRPQTTAAISGVVAASLALLMVAATFFVKLAYRDYFTCVDDALTRASAKSCEKLLPKEFRPLLGSQEE